MNKVKIHNKHFAYLVLKHKMGQLLGAIPGRVHRSNGQTRGQSLNPGRRGVVWNEIESVGPTRVATNYHQSGGGEMVC